MQSGAEISRVKVGRDLVVGGQLVQLRSGWPLVGWRAFYMPLHVVLVVREVAL